MEPKTSLYPKRKNNEAPQKVWTRQTVALILTLMEIWDLDFFLSSHHFPSITPPPSNCSAVLFWYDGCWPAFRREESYSSFFPGWKLLFPFSPRSTYHNNIASMTSAASEQFSLQIFGRINGRNVRENAELLFFLLCYSFPLSLLVAVFLKTLTHKDGRVPAERMMGGKQVIGCEVKVEERKKRPSTHHFKAHMCHPLHAWPQPFHVP